MSFYEMICFAKVYNVACGIAHPATVSENELDVAVEVIKRMIDNRDNWTQEQKEIYKLIADYAKDKIEGR